mgnify:CR=1 FL=1
MNQPGQTFIGDNYLTCDEISPDTGISAYGRVYEITGVDEFTQQFYRSRFGMDFPLGAIQFAKPPEPMPIQEPPYNGFGDE